MTIPKHFTILFLFLFCYNNIQAQEWIEEYPIPTNLNIHDLYFVNTTRGWILGESGLLMVTNDGGDTWFHQDANTNQTLRSSWFINKTEGWLVGDSSTILHTIDAGNTWQQQSINGLAHFTKVQFIDTQTGWATTLRDSIYRTTNGGQTWQKVIVGSTAYFKDIDFVNANKGWLLTDTTTWKTNNGGQTWTKQNVGTSLPLYGFDFIDDNYGYIAGELGTSFRTIDGGGTWQAITIPISNNYALRDMYFSDSLTGITLRDNLILKTTDGGDNWSFHGGGIYHKLFFVDPMNVWGLKSSGWAQSISRSINGASNWNELHDISGAHLLDVHAIDSNRVWAVGTKDVLYSDDNGRTWNQRNNSIGIPVYEVEFDSSGQNGWLISTWLRVFNTTDGGLNWTLSPSLGTPIVTEQLHEIDFINSQTGWVGSSYGHLFKTTNGGQNWQAIATGFGRTNMLKFINSQTGWMAETSQTFKSTDGGLNWIKDSLNFGTSNIYDMEFVDSLNGWAVGSNFTSTSDGVVVRTRNGGATWTTTNVPGTTLLNSVSFTDTLNGWVTDGFGEIWHSTDGGVTWNQEVKNTNEKILELSGAATNYCWGVGEVSTIVRYQNCNLATPLINESNGMLSTGIFSNYQWYYNGVPIPSATQQNYNPTLEGIYTVRAYNNNNCEQYSNAYIFENTVSSIHNMNSEYSLVDITIYPNPTNGTLSVATKNLSIESIDLINLNGQVVQQFPLIKQAKFTLFIKEELTNGIYILKIKNQDQLISKKVVLLKN